MTRSVNVLIREKDIIHAREAWWRLKQDEAFSAYYDRHERLIVDKIWGQPGDYKNFVPASLPKRARERVYAKSV